MTIEVLQQILSFEVVIFSIIGTIIGSIFAAIPGLNGAIAITILLPITYRLTPAIGLAFVGGIYMGSMYGGSITAILINVPGCVEATCTAYDGYPLTLQGRSREALYYSIFSSTFGGFLGILALIVLTPMLAKVALKFGPSEMFILGICGLTIIGALSGNNVWKSIFSACFGMFLATIGPDIASTAKRFTFGLPFLTKGLSSITLVLGIFCIAEMMRDIGMNQGWTSKFVDKPIKKMTVVKDILFKHNFLWLKSALLGLFIGILPGIGGGTAVFAAYGNAKRASKDPKSFGKGNPEGIIAAESANNAVVGGALIPLLGLGIPGSSTTAIMASVLTINGIICGPDLFTKRPEVAYIFMGAMMITVVAMALIGVFGIRWFNQILRIKMYYLVPMVIACAFFGAYSTSNNVRDILLIVIIGLVALFLTKLEVPTSPMIVGFVLSSMIEQNFRRTLKLASTKGLSFFGFIFSKPLSLALLALLVVLIVVFCLTGEKKDSLKSEE